MASSRINFRPEAMHDLDEATTYYLEVASEELAVRFLHAVDESLGRLVEMPRMGRLFKPKSKLLSGLRVWHVEGFEAFLILYRPVNHGIDVFRVFHGARHLRSIIRGTDWN